MDKLNYKVAASGKVTALTGKTKLSALWLEEDVPLHLRAQLRKQLDPLMVRAAWIVFGRKCLPADINTLLEYKHVVRQVMADNPKLLAPIYSFVQSQSLKATPYHSLVKRFKDVLRKEGFEPRQRNGGYWQKPRKETDVNSYWEWSSDGEGLTEGGWRYLLSLPFAVIREHFMEAYSMKDRLPALNKLNQLGLTNLSKGALKFAFDITRYRTLDDESCKAVLLSLRDASALNDGTLYRQADIVQDWLRSEKPEVHPGTTWSTLVGRAVTFALIQAELDRTELQDLRWEAPVKPFVTTDGLVVRPLENGAELLDEGHAMSNCLSNMKSYAHDAVKGKSLVFSISGVAGRATVEFYRRSENGQWSLRQAEEAGNQPVKVPALTRAVKQVEMMMKEVA